MSADTNTHGFFVIAKKDSSELVTTVMHAGGDGQEEALVVFTKHSAAEIYLTQAGWLETEAVAELQTAAFLEWLLQMAKSGPTLIAVNPDRVQQDDDIRQKVISVSDLIDQLGPAITDCLTASELTAT